MEAALGKLLTEDGNIPAERLDEAVRLSVLQGGRLDTYLLELGLIDEATLTDVLARAYQMPPASFPALIRADLDALKVIPSRVAERCQVFPFRSDGEDLHVLSPAPPDIGLLEEIGEMVSRRLVPHAATEYRIARALAHFYGVPLKPRFVELERVLAGDLKVKAGEGEIRTGVQPVTRLRAEGTGTEDGRWDLIEALAQLSAAQDRDTVIGVSLHYAKNFFDCAAFFGVHERSAIGWDVIGAKVQQEGFRGFTLSLDNPSALSTVVETAASYLGQIERSPAHDALFRALGRRRPRTALLHPILVAGRAVAILYGDNGRRAIRTNDLTDMITFCGRIGPVLENIIVARKRDIGSEGEAEAAEAAAEAVRAEIEAADEPADEPTEEVAEAVAEAAIEEDIGVAEAADETAEEVAEAVVEAAIEEDIGADETADETAAEIAEAVTEAAIEEDISAEPPLAEASSADDGGDELQSALAAAAEAAADEVDEEAAADDEVDELQAALAAAAAEALEEIERVEESEPEEAAKADDEGASDGLSQALISFAEESDADEAKLAAAAAEVEKEPPEVAESVAEAEAEAEELDGWEEVVYEALGASEAAAEETAGEGGNGESATELPQEEQVVFEDIDESTGAQSWGGALRETVEAGHQGGEMAPTEGVFNEEAEEVRFDEIVEEVVVRRDKMSVQQEKDLVIHRWTDVPLKVGTPKKAEPPPDDGSLKPEEAIRLCNVLAGPNGEATEAAAARLDEQADEKLVPTLITLFPGRVQFDPFGADWNLPDPVDLSPMMNFLVKRTDLGADVALAHLDSHFPALRWFAVYLFTKVHDPRAIKSVMPRLHDEEPRIRHLAAEALMNYVADAGFDVVIRHLRSRLGSPVSEVRRRAIYFLGYFKDVGSVPHLISCLGAREPELVAETTQALAAITMQTLGTSHKRWYKWWEKSRNRSRIDWLIDGLRHKDRNIRYAASVELAAIAKDSFDYDYDSKKRDRDKAVKRWERWWASERKRMRLDG